MIINYKQDDKKYAFTVLVLTYNAIWKKLKLTLDGILKQDFQDYEIVLCDDGSKNNLKDIIIEYFEKQGFDRYVLVLNEQNQGTVKNIISGLEVSKGKYIRDFGPGDLFYSFDSLERIYSYMEANSFKLCFGRLKGYSIGTNDDINYCEYTFPFDIKAYKKFDIKRIKKNLVLCTDNIVGASMILEKDLFLYYMRKISPNVKYLEDIFPILAALDGEYFHFYDDYLMWYECDTGVSTSGNNEFRKLLFKDRDSLNEYISREYASDLLVKKRIALNEAYKIDNPYKRVLKMALKEPYALKWAISHYIQVLTGKYKGQSMEGFLNTDGFEL